MSSTATSGTPRPSAPGDQGRSPNGSWRGLTPLSLFLILILVWVMTQIQIVLVLGLLALLLGTILEGPVSMLERRHMPRPAAIAAVYAALIGGLVLLVFAIVPLVSDQASTFRDEVPGKLRELEAEWKTSSNPLLSGIGDRLLVDAIKLLDSEPGEVNVSADAAQQILPVVTSIGSVLVSTVSLLVITFYYLLEKSFLKRVILDQIGNPTRRARVAKVWSDVERKVGGWMRGQLVLCLIIGTIATVSYGIIGLPFWPLLGLWAGLTEFFPIVGPWIGGVPAVILALTVGWKEAVFTGIIILLMQTLENWFLVPRVMRGAVGLTPLTVFVAILAGQQFLGVVGAILAIPVAATIQVILTDYLAGRRDLGHDEEPMSSGWRWMLSRTNLREVGSSAPGDEEYGDHQQVVSDVITPTGDLTDDEELTVTTSAPTSPSAPIQTPAPAVRKPTSTTAPAKSGFSWHRTADGGSGESDGSPPSRG